MELLLGRREVVVAVRLDGERGILAEEVDDVGPERLLASKLRPVESPAA
jgi:hypothetical protein